MLIGQVKVTMGGGLKAKPGSIWANLAARLGREPSAAEVNAECRRILFGSK